MPAHTFFASGITVDWTINLTSITTGLLLAIVSYFGRKLMTFLHDLTYRMDLLWRDYQERHPDEFGDDLHHRRHRPPYSRLIVNK